MELDKSEETFAAYYMAKVIEELPGQDGHNRLVRFIKECCLVFQKQLYDLFNVYWMFRNKSMFFGTN